jgi:nickel transport protein
MKQLSAFILMSALLGSTAASAHGAWVAERHGEFYVVYGHGAADDAYDPAKVTSLQACTLALECTDIARRDAAEHVAFAKPEAPLIRLGFDNGFWSKGADGEWQNLPKDQVAGATESGHYVKTGTFVTGHLEEIPAAFGTGLEVRPLADPMALTVGGTLPVEVLFDGKPAEGAELIADYVNNGDAEPIIVGADGRAEVPITSAGLTVMVAFLTTPSADPAKADEMGHAASLAFALEHGPE